MREYLESLSLSELREIAKKEGIKSVTIKRKPELVEMLLEIYEKQQQEKREAIKREQVEEAKTEIKKEQIEESKEPKEPKEPKEVKAESDAETLFEVHGILEVLQEGYAFIRNENFLPGNTDVYVSPTQIKTYNLRTGDILSGKAKPTSKFPGLVVLDSVNGESAIPEILRKRRSFENLTPVFPNERIRLSANSSDVSLRIVDLFSPIGKGQRGMIVSPPKAGKTTLLKKVAKAILDADKDMHIIILLVDERPEEVTDMKECITGDNVEIIYSTFDELPDRHKRVAEMVIERAKRLVEMGRDVTILLDSITRLARAYNITIPPSGRTLSGGLDPASLYMPKKFFGAARNMREGGSLTILATALVDTGSKMDDVVFEEFKGTGNMELVLDRKLSEKRIFPAIDIAKSGTRNERLLLDQREADTMDMLRKALSSDVEEATKNILDQFAHSPNNDRFIELIKLRKLL